MLQRQQDVGARLRAHGSSRLEQLIRRRREDRKIARVRSAMRGRRNFLDISAGEF